MIVNCFEVRSPEKRRRQTGQVHLTAVPNHPSMQPEQKMWPQASGVSGVPCSSNQPPHVDHGFSSNKSKPIDRTEWKRLTWSMLEKLSWQIRHCVCTPSADLRRRFNARGRFTASFSASAEGCTAAVSGCGNEGFVACSSLLGGSATCTASGGVSAVCVLASVPASLLSSSESHLAADSSIGRSLQCHTSNGQTGLASVQPEGQRATAWTEHARTGELQVCTSSRNTCGLLTC